jgi:type III pantothenate kinase
MNILCIDIGNTRHKAYYYHGNVLQWLMLETEPNEISKRLEGDKPDKIVIADVRGQSSWIAGYFDQKDIIYVSSKLDLPIQIAYATPETLGADRIAVAAGAISMFPNTNCLIFNCGTCMTIDFIDAQGTYFGGAISPGLTMRLRAMHEFTGKLPITEFVFPETFVGNNTKTCMHSGVFFGMLDEITGAIHRYEMQFGTLQPIITGGDAALFEKHIKNNIFATPNLVPEGLKHIAQHVIKGN